MARTNSEDSRASNLSLISARLGQLRRDLVADYDMAPDGPMSLFLDPNGSDRTIRLPPLEAGLLVFIYHIGTANVLNVVDSAGNPVSYVEARQLVVLESSEEEWASLGHNFRASGANHSEGLVPDPGPVAGSSRFLREDGIWAGSGAGIVSDAYSFMTDGTNTAAGTGLDTFKFRSSDNTLSLTVTNNDFTHGDNLNLTVNEPNVDHNLLLNYVADQHVAHTGVVLTAGAGLAGGGNISASRTFNLDLNDLTTDTPVLSDTFAFYDVSGADTNKATLTTLNSILDHNALVNFVLNKHVDHSLVAIQAGLGLSGGGDITVTRTLNVDIHGQTLDTPVAGDELMFYDVSGGDVNRMTITTLSTVVDHDTTLNFVANKHIDHSAVSINTPANSGLAGGGNITASRSLTLDINNLTLDTPVVGDSIAFYDLSGTDTNKCTITTLNGILVHNNLSGYVANEHINHTTVTLTAGAGLTGGGDISASRTFAVGAGVGIAVNLDDVALNFDGLTVDTPVSTDLIAFYDVSGLDHNKATLSSVFNAMVPGANTQILFNDSGVFGADAGLTYNKATDTLGLIAGGVISWNSGAASITESAAQLNVLGAWAFTSDISPAQITADQNNYNPTGLSSAVALRLNSDISRSITGLAGGADGRIIIIHNVGTADIVLVDESASSTAGNRFALSANLTLAGDQSAFFQYDATSSRWRMVGGSGGGGGGGAPTNAQYLTLATDATLSAERVLVAGGGLTGTDGGAGGNFTLAVGAGTGITANANDVALNINGLTEDTTPDVEADFVATYDASASTHKKVKIQNISGKVLLASGTIANSATSLDLVLTSYTEYSALEFYLFNVVPATDGSALTMRTSTNGGSSYDAGVSDYSWSYIGSSDDGAGVAGVANPKGDDLDSEITITDSGTGAGSSNTGPSNTVSDGGVCAKITIFNQASAANRTLVYFESVYQQTGGAPDALVTSTNGGGQRKATADVDAVRFLWSSGNFAASSPGTYSVYGVR